jgi:hypothetical protein
MERLLLFMQAAHHSAAAVGPVRVQAPAQAPTTGAGVGAADVDLAVGKDD